MFQSNSIDFQIMKKMINNMYFRGADYSWVGNDDDLRDKAISHIQSDEQESWNLMTFILDNNGSFKLHFEYVNLGESNAVKRRKAWESKFLF